MSKVKLQIRLILLGVMTLALTVVVSISLFDLQLVQTAPAIVKKNDRTYTTDIAVTAARGQIYDRYGRDLVVNRTSYNITLNQRLMSIADSNAPGAAADGILSLITLCKSEDSAYTDTFPVSYTPYRYIEDSAYTQRLTRFLEEIEQPEITAADLMVLLRERYMIPVEYSDDDARMVVGIRYEMELRELIFNIPPYVFASDISVRLMTLIEERRLPGVIIGLSAAREYQTNYAAHILGRTGAIPKDDSEKYQELGYPMDAIVGIDGIEKAAEEWLRGTNGIKRIETTASGQITNESVVKDTQAGMHAFITLDIRLQEAAERALERGIMNLRATGIDKEGGQAQGGAVVVVDVNSGEVLAMASYPTFDLTRFYELFSDLREDPEKPMYNRAIAGTYPPGSIFKMCTGIAALELGAIKPKATIYDQGRYMRYASSNYTPTCMAWRSGGHGNVSIATALKVSCNYYFYEVGYRLGIDGLAEYAAKMGFGRESGIEIDGERIGSLASREYAESQKLRWNPGDVLQSAIGQLYNSFTPLQMAVYTATVANGGLHYRPHLLKSIRSFDFSREAFDIVPEVMDDLQLQPENIKVVQEGMRLVAQTGGTAAKTFATYPIAVAAKTGTAQTTADRPDNGVFVAYAPYDNPEIAIAVVVEKGAGGSRVAPIARDIFTSYFEITGRMKNIASEG